MHIYKYISDLDTIVNLSLLVFFSIQVSVESTPGFYTHNGVLYQYHSQNRTQQQAGDTCASRGLTLLQLQSQGDIDDLQNVTRMLAIQGQFWIQGRARVSDWHWISDNSRLSNQGCYKDYGGSPDLPTEVEIQDIVPDLCITACAKLGFTYAGLQSGYQCFCGPNYGRYNLSQGAPWCSVSCEGDNNQYCGGWNRNTVYHVNGSFSTWAYQQPDNLAGDEACAVVEMSSLDHQFSDQSCYYVYHFICDIPLENCTDAPSFHQQNGRCYYFSSDTKSWFNARLNCLLLDGDLVKIDSEQTFVTLQSILDDHGRTEKHWIGLVKKQWFTPTDEVMQTFLWLDEQPGDMDHECITHEVKGQGWFSWDCDEELPFICTKVMEEIQSVTPPTTTEEITTPTVMAESTQSSVNTDSTRITQSLQTEVESTEIVHQDFSTIDEVISAWYTQYTHSTDLGNASDVTHLGYTETSTQSPTNFPESAAQTGSEVWTVQKIAILVGVLGGIFLATFVVGSIVLFKLKCRPSHGGSTARVSPTQNDQPPSSDKNHNTKMADTQKQPEKEEEKRLDKERLAAMAVTTTNSDMMVKPAPKSLESLC